MSSFTEATWEPTDLRSPRGLRYSRIRGATGEGMTFFIGFVGSTMAVIVPEGFLTDGPSAPRWLLWILRLLGLLKWLIKAAAVHDLLREDERFRLIETDTIFLCALYADDAPKWLCWAAFFAVRLNKSRYKHNAVSADLANHRGEVVVSK